ncbi:protein of unknown function [Devosia sp. YR412]|uniref:DUF1127 domain-containing protein n=1 Tax=Devosia sp. YR412 TaxID=1881030 RepID=UPI0008B1DF53|nr:DUF1127 domain-containing protein [Devosia sp. YR412]SEP61175.1 protein of unknown function [Devosia sp. YR412]
MIETMTRKLVDWWGRQTAVQRLQALDDRLLADMGIKRQDIACSVQGCDDVC